MEVLRRHLVSAEERGNTPGPEDEAGTSGVSREGAGEEGDVQDDEAFPIPYDAPGMDTT